jgi:hypothetical protein
MSEPLCLADELPPSYALLIDDYQGWQDRTEAIRSQMAYYQVVLQYAKPMGDSTRGLLSRVRQETTKCNEDANQLLDKIRAVLAKLESVHLDSYLLTERLLMIHECVRQTVSCLEKRYNTLGRAITVLTTTLK